MVNVNRVDPSAVNYQQESSDQYLTQPGDTLQGVAASFGSDPAALAAANPFIANPQAPLPPGVYLKIPSKPAKEPPAKEREREQNQEQGQEQEPSPSQLETVSNNPIANSKRDYELSRGDLSLAALSLSVSSPAILPNPPTTGRYTPEHLLADTAFTNFRSMDSSQIQRLFHEKGSGLATLILPDGRPASRVVETAAQSSRVNPQVLLVLLQRDSGLISGSYSRNIEKERLDWCFGLGEGRLERLRGFDRQMEFLARRLAQSYAQNLPRVPTSIQLDSHKQRVENAATLTLYQTAPRRALAELFAEIWKTLFGCAGLGRPAK